MTIAERFEMESFIQMCERFLSSGTVRVAMLVPRWLVEACVIRCAIHATSGKFESTPVSTLTVAKALNRWDMPNE